MQRVNAPRRSTRAALASSRTTGHKLAALSMRQITRGGAMTQKHMEKVPLQSSDPAEVMADLRHRIEHILKTRREPGGTLRARIENTVKHDLSRVWGFMKARPMLGVALISGSAFVLASTVGVGELVITLAVAYGAYLVLREGVPVAK